MRVELVFERWFRPEWGRHQQHARLHSTPDDVVPGQLARTACGRVLRAAEVLEKGRWPMLHRRCSRCDLMLRSPRQGDVPS